MKLAFSGVLFILCIIYTIMSFDLTFIDNGRPGAGFFPTILGLLLVVLTGRSLIAAFKERAGEKNFGVPVYSKDVLVLIISIAILTALLKVLGGLICMILFVFVILFLFNKGKYLQNTLISIIVPVAIFILFELWLNAGIPQGILDPIL